ncbi:S41 family peptidase [Qipengyuania sediminis]|uniref:S41 family peptidase n=1 Tax=Qipengyuania sediminis TaxID=1532023 RepID=UPI001404AF07|nr:S41 family peptidase [Qipengyuania sediminis]
MTLGIKLAGLLLATSALAAPAAAETRLLGDPALSDRQLAFTYAGDIWVAAPDGSNPRRITSHAADESDPIFSPDGSMIAFNANYDGNYDVFVMPASGGTPRRLTFHPGQDLAADFTPDGRAVLFATNAETGNGRSGELFTVPVTGGFPTKLSGIRSRGGAYDAATGRIANLTGFGGYNALWGGSSGWRGYRGGQQPQIEIVDLAKKTLAKVPGEGSNNFAPRWDGGQLYFLSDRDNKVINVFRADPAGGAPVKLTNETEWDVRRFAIRGGRIVYEAGGALKERAAGGGAARTLPITVTADLPAKQPQWKQVAAQIEDARLSPSAKRVAFTARGEVFTVPTDQGSTRNISASAAVRDYTGIWSKDGTRLAYVTDTGTGQELVIEDQTGTAAKRRVPLGPDFYRLLDWGGDGKTIVYSSNKLELRGFDTAANTSFRIATSARRNGDMGAVLSPAGRWLAYTTRGANFNAALYLYDLTTRRAFPVSGEFADIGSPAFSKDGKLLFFTASTNAGPGHVGLDMSSQQQPYRAGIYAVVLERAGTSPLAPVLANEGDAAGSPDAEDEPEGEKKARTKSGAASQPQVDPADLTRRMVPLPVAEGFHASLATGKDGALYFVTLVQPGVATAAPGAMPEQADAQLMRFDFEKRTATSLMRGVTGVETDAKGETLLLRKADDSFVTSKAGEKLDPKPVDTASLRVLVDPAAEWRQIFNDAWRMEKAYFYDANMHGLDRDAVRAKYEPLLVHVGRREDLNRLLAEMIGEMQVGHNRVGGGDIWKGPGGAAPGLLGADIRLEGGRYIIKRIYDGEQWNPFLAAPLAAPGVDVKAGDAIVAINGRELKPSDNIHEALLGTAGTQIAVTVQNGAGPRRTSVVVPIPNDRQLRRWSWIEDNRRYVDRATGGRVAYVYMPDTADDGFTFFNRMFFAQTNKEALILDERSNGGGQAANYVIDVLRRPYLSGWKDREGLVFNTPGGAIHGPKAMLIDQDAGSGGDWLPYAFRQAGLGPLIGTRTWGGLIGISANPDLIDGGFLTVPNFRFFDTEGRWSVENEGVAPDMRVELDQMTLDAGRDTQLDAAIGHVMAELAKTQRRDPNWHPPKPTELGK